MWRLYCPGDDGVAIRTTFAKLRDSVNDPHTCVSEVKYFDYKTGRFPRRDPAFHKRSAFKHEQEVRVLRHDVADWRKASKDEAFRLPAGYELQWDPAALAVSGRGHSRVEAKSFGFRREPAELGVTHLVLELDSLAA
jgi:hypothetical protein